MAFVEVEGDTLDDAIDNALKSLGVDRDKVTVDILSEGRKGIFGFGAQKAKIRATLRQSASVPAAQQERPEPRPAAISAAEIASTAEKAKGALAEILRLMEIRATVEAKAGETSDEIILDVRSENNALLIGRKGQTLEALEYLVIRIAGERPGGEGAHIVVDVENYRERRRRSLQDLALRMGEKAKRQRKTVTVDALSAADRRIVHAALQDDPWVTTRSLGQGSYRRLLIIPEGDRRKKEEPDGATAAKSAAKEAK
ncbi:MAG TPA: RNA-binding cell elongation regulator Jag/EloR [Candidatus Binatia bacterium]|nr:RNA-binding cell elongation regulator Jag/EloR [Candidatus Binatia bacterium]